MLGLAEASILAGLGAQNQMDARNQQNIFKNYQSLGQPGWGSQQAQYQSPQATTKETEVATETELLPDISLTRAFKWGIVLIIAMALGRRVWEMFGPKIEANLHKALGSAEKKPE